MYKRILVPVDGSPPSQLGLGHAVGLAKPLGARIRLLNVVDELSLVSAADAAAVADLATLIAGLQEAGQRVLDDCARYVAAHGVEYEEVQLQSQGGHVSAVIVRDAEDWRADLICIGTHGRRGITRLILGSDAERVSREARMPVLLVRGAEDASGGRA